MTTRRQIDQLKQTTKLKNNMETSPSPQQAMPAHPPTSEQVRKALRLRVIERANRRRDKQQSGSARQSRTKSTGSKESHRLPASAQSGSSAKKKITILPAVAAEPKLTPKAIRALEFAVKSMERKDWSLNRRRLAAHHHLQSDPMIANIIPDELIVEEQATNS